METLTLIGQTLFTGLLTGWLAIGLIENFRAPGVNRDLVSAVLNMERIARERPEIHVLVKGNAIVSPRVHGVVWVAILVAETLATLALTAGTGALALAALGLVGAEPARLIAGAGVLGFTAIWGGMLVGGQWVHYWAVWKDSQFTHYFMTLWGVVTFLALILP